MALGKIQWKNSEAEGFSFKKVLGYHRKFERKCSCLCLYHVNFVLYFSCKLAFCKCDFFGKGN